MIPLSDAAGCDCQSKCPETLFNQRRCTAIRIEMYYIKLHIP